MLPPFQLHEAQQVGRPPPHGGPAQAEVAGVDEQVLEHGEVLVEVVLLGDDPDPRAHLPGLAVGVQLQHVKLAGGPPQPAEEHLHGGGLAGAVGAQEAEALAVLDLEVDAVHGAAIGKGLDEAAGLGSEGQGCYSKLKNGARVSARGAEGSDPAGPIRPAALPFADDSPLC